MFQGLLNDFQSQNRTTYKAAHVYFTEGREGFIYFLFIFCLFYLFSAIPDRLFKLMKEAEGSKSFKSLVEVNISFVPYESQVRVLLLFYGGGFSTKLFNQLFICLTIFWVGVFDTNNGITYMRHLTKIPRTTKFLHILFLNIGFIH